MDNLPIPQAERSQLSVELSPEVLRRKAALFDAQLGATIDGVLIVDSQGRKIVQNRRIAELFKIPPEIFDDPDDRVMVGYVTRLIKSPEKFLEKVAYLYDHPMETSRDEVELLDGTVLDRYSSPVLGREGEYLGRIWTFRDMTDRRRAEVALKQSEERLQVTLETTQIGIWDWDVANDIWFASPTYNTMLGYEPDKGRGERTVWLSRIHADDLANVKARIEAVLLHHAEEYCYEARLRHADGTYRWQQVKGKVVAQDAQGRPLRLVGVRIDIDDRKRLEHELMHSQKMEAIGHLAGGVAHDFNNILAAIMLNLDLLLMEKELTESQRASLRDLLDDAKRAADLTRQLLLFARRQVMQLQSVNLGQALDNMVKMLRRLLGEKVELVLSKAAVPLWVQADPGMIEQVLMNLCLNARDAMPAGGLLNVDCSPVEFSSADHDRDPETRSGSFIRLSVGDTGIGMSEEVLARLFEPFFTTKDVGKGTGLGLAIVYSIVTQHNGWIKVSSQPGHGSCFRVFLPCAAPPETAKSTASPDASSMRGAETILLVEDEQPLRKMLGHTLRSLGYRVVEASNGKEAQALWHELRDKPDLLLTDMVMPEGMTGMELYHQLSLLQPGLRVVISSGYSEEIVDAGLVARGKSVRLLVKPYTTEALARTLRECLASP